MKLRRNVCNRCRLVCVKFYLNRSRFAVVVANCSGAHFLGHTVHILKIVYIYNEQREWWWWWWQWLLLLLLFLHSVAYDPEGLYATICGDWRATVVMQEIVNFRPVHYLGHNRPRQTTLRVTCAVKDHTPAMAQSRVSWVAVTLCVTYVVIGRIWPRHV